MISSFIVFAVKNTIGTLCWVWVTERLQGRMFNPFRWGAYIAYQTYPDRKTFMNSWHDHLGEAALREYFKVHDTDPGWESVLDEHDVSWVLYETRSRLGQALRRSEDWEEVHRDPTARAPRGSRLAAGAICGAEGPSSPSTVRYPTPPSASLSSSSS